MGRNSEVRRLLLLRHPEWKGRIWLLRDTVIVRGVRSVMPRYSEKFTPEQEVDHLLFYLDDLIRRHSDLSSIGSSLAPARPTQ